MPRVLLNAGTLLPAVLGLLGDKVNALRIHRRKARTTERHGGFWDGVTREAWRPATERTTEAWRSGPAPPATTPELWRGGMGQVTARPIAAASLVALALVAGGGGCGRSEASKAAESAQDACITALEPVSEGDQPSVAVVDRAVEDAEEAAAADGRWSSLRRSLRRLRDDLGTADAGRSLSVVVADCERVNDIVRSGGREGGIG